MATVITNQVKNLERGGFPAIGPKVGMLEANITLGGVTDAANEAVAVFTFESAMVVMNAGLEVVTPTTNSITASLGYGGGGGAAVQFCGEVDVSAAAGTQYSGGQGVANVIMPAADNFEIEVSGDAGAAGEVRIWAIVADIEDL